MMNRRHALVVLLLGGIGGLILGGCAGATTFPRSPDGAPPLDQPNFPDTRFIVGDRGDHELPVVDGNHDVSRLPDVLTKDKTSTTCTPGLCRTCVNGRATMPKDDPACGVIDCDGLDTYVVKGTASATGTNYRVKRDYADLTQGRCKALGRCKAPNSTDCTQVTETTVNTCGACLRATTSGCTPYPNGTECKGVFAGCDDSLCFSGTCAWRLYALNNGSVSCQTFCMWDQNGRTCKGAAHEVNGTITIVDCTYNRPGEVLLCYCVGPPHCT